MGEHCGVKVCISIHALREESDVIKQNEYVDSVKFQSTLSVRRATIGISIHHMLNIIFQSTLSVRRATFIIYSESNI